MAPSPHSIDRREALRRAALLLGGAVSAPTLAAVLAGCDTRATPRAAAAPPLTADQAETIATVAEHIIPETDTPGARSAGVPAFIATMLAEYYTPEQRAHFLDGVAQVDTRARAQYGRPFLRCTTAQQHAVVAALDAETFATAPRTAPASAASSAAAATDASKETERGGGGAQLSAPVAPTSPRNKAAAQPPFFRMMKELTVIGYYTSQPGATKELRYVQVPGRFDGCVPLAKIGRAWAV